MPLLGRAKRDELVAATLIVASLVLLILPGPTRDSLARRANHAVMLPIAQARVAFSGHLGLREENERLRTELQRARLELARSRTLRVQNREMRRLLGFAAGQPVRLVPARVVDRDFGTLPTNFVLDRGADDGLAADQPVVTVDGLVGKTIDVSTRASRVMLYSHPDFSASALLVGGDHLEYGIVRPTPTGGLRLFLPLRSESKSGDPVVTSGYGGSFPRGIPVGRISVMEEEDRLGLQRIDRVDPVVDLGSVTTVFVLRRVDETSGPAGDIVRLFWPEYAYPPMAGERLRGRADSIPAAEPDTGMGPDGGR